jgi:hypothetical protein
MLTPTEQTTVIDTLANELAQSGDVRTYVTTTFTPREGPILRELPTTLVKPDDQAAFVVSYCLEQRWPLPPDKALMEVLLAAMVTSGRADLVPLRDRVALGDKFDPNPDPFMSLWVRDTLPFFSRTQLRPIVKALLGNNSQPILRITGPEASGKTYTRELIDHVCTSTRTDVHVALAEVAKGAGPSYPVEELADTLVTPTIRDVATRPLRTTSNYPASLSRWILNAAVQSPGRWIYVLDGFNQPNLQSETRQLVETLAQQIANPGDFRKRMRMVLVDFNARLPSVQVGAVMNEIVPPAATLTPQALADCLDAHYRDLATRGRPKGTVVRSELEATAASLIADATSNDALDLQQLNDTLTQLRMADLGI